MAWSQSAALPNFIPPQLATPTDKAPAGGDWIHEIERDGYRSNQPMHGG